ncbi:cytochrome c oxidase subunit 4 isoform 1, mitochondrial-like [Coccinella septempunctata]|uniref:cytochrome c oxidase subunit 4 isoform 1, mitochondrial-like n=1 Tax=Coccinella septempunctata TaxID=41139 RepID=UPI001D092EC9|nr:cytochrome c oxidase subunit 4 isoform 1, mitochondrial-like [Coccinella septempunctata]
MSMFSRSQSKIKSLRGIHINVPLLKFNPLVYAPPYKRDAVTKFRVGNREVVGYGWNGEPNYGDRSLFPFPSIRYKEPTQEILALREREKGNWKLLSKEDKKALYRASFCQTFAEFSTPRPGGFCEVIGWTLMWLSVGLWISIGIQYYVNPELPDSFTPTRKRAQMRRQILLQVDPVFGMASNWDYEKMDWKKVGWFTPPNPFIICPDDLDEDDEENES